MSEANLASIEHYQRVISVMPEPSLIVAINGDILAYNRPASTLLDLVRDKNLTAHSPLPAEVLQNYLRRCSRNKELLVGAFEMKTLRGDMVLSLQGCAVQPRSEKSEALLLVRFAPRSANNIHFKILRDQVGKLNQEAARRQHAEYDLLTQKKWLEVTLASIGDAVITTDTSGKVTYMNPVAESMTGWNNTEAVGKPLNEVFVVVHEHSLQPVENPAEKALREGCIVALANHTALIARDGRAISIEDTAAPIAQDGQVNGAVLVFHDVSETRNLEKQLLKRARSLAAINKRKNEFLTMLAHELRSPLTPLSNALNILQLQGDLPATATEPMAVIHRQMSHLRRLVDDLLDVSRITRGKMNITRENLNLNSLIQTICQDMQEEFQRADIKFSFAIADDEAWVNADLHRLTQVLHNILTNALKFTPPGEFVHLALRTADAAKIVVSDTGCGIDEILMGSLFEPFSQATQSLDRAKGGLGIGLSLAKGIMELHGGSIELASEGTNRGTTVTLTLPLIEAQQKPAVVPTSAPSAGERIILLIEDEADAAQTMYDLLTLMGHRVYVAKSGAEGLRKAAAFDPDLVICDIGLPELNGFEVATQLQESPLTQHIPLIALTGYGGAEFVQKAKKSGFRLHITKPATMDDIARAIALANRTLP